ncbi:MAG TPA: putative zinc-binding metallopeptidase [Acidimicrobiales bacterium]|nr:putative zinc-binding metallopeptidase [Acidimicrobiales bacterium]
MRAFVCRRCRELAPFESQECRRCGALLGFDPVSANLEPLHPAGPGLVRFDPGCGADNPNADNPNAGNPNGGNPNSDNRWARCSRSALADCNWLVPIAEAGKPCLSCRLTLNLPPKGDEEYRDAYSKAEQAKRRLIFQLRQLDLPLTGRDEDPEAGLAFELLASDRHVVTGHENGIVTIDLNETDDAFREQTRAQFGEPYRTLLGHFRHEVGHYYWARLIAKTYGDGARPGRRTGHRAGGPAAGCWLEEARCLFGDDRVDYEAARDAHYAKGPSLDWGENHVSAYAAMHPLEDWAETFAHYLHIWDAVQTAASFGVLVGGPVDDRTGRRDPAKASAPSEDTAFLEGFDAVIADWLPLTLALNALNRSLGKDDLYPFELPPAVIAKLAFVHRVITSSQ